MIRVASLHEDVFGSAPEGVWSAPGRVNLIGEHTDYNEGLVLPIALPHRTYAACSPRADRLLRLHSAQVGETVEVELDAVGPGSPTGWTAYVAGVLWALAQDGHDVRGLDVTVDSEVPVGAGLSSSAALECAVGAAASDLFGLDLLVDDASRAGLAQACVRAENEVAGAMTGGMDQSAALLCRVDHALLLDCRSGATEQVPFHLGAATASGATMASGAATASGGVGTGSGHVLLVTDTRAAHALNDGQYAQRRSAAERAAAELGVASLRDVEPAGLDDALARLSEDVLRRRARHVVTEIDRVREAVAALRAGDLAEVGRLFDASHASLRDDYEVSSDALDALVDIATGVPGVIGARLTGAGFGGCTINLVHDHAVEPLRAAVLADYPVRTGRTPMVLEVRAADGARRVG